MANAGYSASVLELHEAQATAHKLGLDVATLEIRRAEDIAPAFETLKGGVDALYVVGDPLTTSNRIRINTLALGAQNRHLWRCWKCDYCFETIVSIKSMAENAVGDEISSLPLVA
jgi:hypothetical protein